MKRIRFALVLALLALSCSARPAAASRVYTLNLPFFAGHQVCYLRHIPGDGWWLDCSGGG